jgi:hypothetical protein
MRLLKITVIVILFAILFVIIKNTDAFCKMGRDGHVADTKNGTRMFISHTEINHGIPIMKLCSK